jgi:hypothetical protein
MPPSLNDVVATFARLVAGYYGSAVFISIVLEVFAQLTGRRARTLRSHLIRLFSAPLANRILDNPLIRKVRREDDGGYFASARRLAHRQLKGVDFPIAYIDPRDFALALMFEVFDESKSENRTRKVSIRAANEDECNEKDLQREVQRLLNILLDTKGKPAVIRKQLDEAEKCLPPEVRRLIDTLLQATNGNPAAFQERLEAWFRRDQNEKYLPPEVHRLLETLLQDTNGNPAHTQERLEAWFRRDQAQLTAAYGTTSRWWGVFLGTLLASFIGLDTLKFLDPIFPPLDRVNLHEWVAHMFPFLDSYYPLGFVISGFMISQGASFWFDISKKLTNVRGESRP